MPLPGRLHSQPLDSLSIANADRIWQSDIQPTGRALLVVSLALLCQHSLHCALQLGSMQSQASPVCRLTGGP